MFIVHVHCSLFMFIVHCSHGATLIFDDVFLSIVKFVYKKNINVINQSLPLSPQYDAFNQSLAPYVFLKGSCFYSDC